MKTFLHKTGILPNVYRYIYMNVWVGYSRNCKLSSTCASSGLEMVPQTSPNTECRQAGTLNYMQWLYVATTNIQLYYTSQRNILLFWNTSLQRTVMLSRYFVQSPQNLYRIFAILYSYLETINCNDVFITVENFSLWEISETTALALQNISARLPRTHFP